MTCIQSLQEPPDSHTDEIINKMDETDGEKTAADNNSVQAAKETLPVETRLGKETKNVWKTPSRE